MTTYKKILVLLAIFILAGNVYGHDPLGPGKAAIASAHFEATEAGHEVLAAGGNAFDAAIAVSAALSVVEPFSSGIGGGGFWLLHLAGENKQVFIDGRETAPREAHRDMYLDDDGQVNRELAVNGPLAAGIPGLPAALVHLAENYGRLPLKKSLAPAIRLAREGFATDPKFVKLMGWKHEVIKRWPAAASVFLDNGEVPGLGYVVKQPDLAVTLELMAEHGWAGFYQGELADKLVSGVRREGGIWQQADLESYRVVEREPLYTEYQGYQLVTAPPPSSGGVAITEVLNILSGYPLKQLDEAQQSHLIIEAMRRAYRDRSIYLGDPDFVDIPLAMLADKDYAAGLRASIRRDQATPSSMLAGNEEQNEGSDTTHYSIIDSEGNIVAATQTVNLAYGSCYMVPGTGFLLNNEMDDFSAKPGEPNAFGLIGFTANAIEPGKRMLSSMSPTFVINQDRIAVLGTPGGSRIITMVLLGVLDFIEGNGPESWVSLPRYHHQYLPDQISLEPDAMGPEVIRRLQELGHQVKQADRTWGNMHGVMWDRRNGKLFGASDPRWAVGRAIVR